MRPKGIPTPRPIAIIRELESLRGEAEGGVCVGDISLAPVDAVDAEPIMPNGVDDVEPDVEDELDVRLLNVKEELNDGLLDVEPGICPRITVPTGAVNVDTPAVQQLSPQQ
jgi:hypothetical protein